MGQKSVKSSVFSLLSRHYLSRKILKKLGHEITEDSQVDKGTEVRLSLWKKELEMY